MQQQAYQLTFGPLQFNMAGGPDHAPLLQWGPRQVMGRVEEIYCTLPAGGARYFLEVFHSQDCENEMKLRVEGLPEGLGVTLRDEVLGMRIEVEVPPDEGRRQQMQAEEKDVGLAGLGEGAPCCLSCSLPYMCPAGLRYAAPRGYHQGFQPLHSW